MKLFVIKNLITNKYYTGYNLGGKCTTKYISKAEFFNVDWVKICQKPNENTLGKNERFVEVKVTERKKDV